MDPWFSCPASVEVEKFVETKLQTVSGVPNTNYATWKEQMLRLIDSQGLLPFIDGSISIPPLQHQNYYVRRRIDELLKGWIIDSLTDPIATDVVGLTTARDVWLHLEKKHGPKSTIAPIEEAYRAALAGVWEPIRIILTNDRDALKKWIDSPKVAMLLRIAVETGKRTICFVKDLIELLDDGKLEDDKLEALRDSNNNTPLHIAASVGNKDATIMLVNSLPLLCYEQNKFGDFPIHTAAVYAQKDVLQYLISKTKVNYSRPNPYAGYEGQQLLSYLIAAELFDIALYLADTYSYILSSVPRDDISPLKLLIAKVNASKTKKFKFWERCVSYMPRGRVVQVQTMANQHAIRLLKCMCKEIGSLDFKIAAPTFRDAVLFASELGDCEVVELIIETFPGALYSSGGPSGQYILNKAIEHHSKDVFNLIYEMGDHQHLFISDVEDKFGNTPLHSAGKLAPPHKLNEISGAALQMQREIQWFERVEKCAHPRTREQMNYEGKTPKMVFTEEHQNLKQEGEKWMKDTANSSIIVAALIATVMVTGAITVPGGNESKTGYPTFAKDAAFIIFAFSNAASLFTSVTSLLLFLAIVTSRYAERDFLFHLPKRLICGLSSLFLSITFMMISYGATLYLVFGQKKLWVLSLVLIFACLPVTSFVWLQLPLLVDLISSTYG